MKEKKLNTCKGTTQSGAPCKRKAGRVGYCSLHNPVELKRKKQIAKIEKQKENRIYELINLVIMTGRAKGWNSRSNSLDKNDWRYASLSVSRSENYNEVTALVEIVCNSTISISVEKTSFHSYGLDNLKRALSDGLNSITWIKPKNKKSGEENTPNFISVLYQLLRRFDILVRQLKHRYADREPVHIDDEYDVQYILHALLRGIFSDVRVEEVSPSYAGASSRQDFLLKDEQIVIETKMANKSLKDKQIGEQLIIDIERYQAHPDCKKLVCFVYDPNNHIRNPAGLENDLKRKTDGFEVIVFVVPH